MFKKNWIIYICFSHSSTSTIITNSLNVISIKNAVYVKVEMFRCYSYSQFASVYLDLLFQVTYCSNPGSSKHIQHFVCSYVQVRSFKLVEI